MQIPQKNSSLNTDQILPIGGTGIVAAGAAVLISYGVYKAVTKNSKTRQNTSESADKPNVAAPPSDEDKPLTEPVPPLQIEAPPVHGEQPPISDGPSNGQEHAPEAANNDQENALNTSSTGQENAPSTSSIGQARAPEAASRNAADERMAAAPIVENFERPKSVEEQVQMMHATIARQRALSPAELSAEIRGFAQSVRNSDAFDNFITCILLAKDANLPSVVHQALRLAWIKHSPDNPNAVSIDIQDFHNYRNCRTDAERLAHLGMDEDILTRSRDTGNAVHLEQGMNRQVLAGFSIVVDHFYLPRISNANRILARNAFRNAGLILR